MRQRFQARTTRRGGAIRRTGRLRRPGHAISRASTIGHVWHYRDLAAARKYLLESFMFGRALPASHTAPMLREFLFRGAAARLVNAKRVRRAPGRYGRQRAAGAAGTERRTSATARGAIAGAWKDHAVCRVESVARAPTLVRMLFLLFRVF
jgi:hypothetical protein